MKILTIIILMMICLCGCQISQLNSTNPTETTRVITQDVGQSNTRLPSRLSIDEYDLYIPHLTSLYKDFISYDDLKNCGTMELFSYSKNGEGYYYNLRDANNFSYAFHIIYGPTTGDLDMDKLDVHRDPSDLRFNENLSGFYFIGNIRYAYFEGKLYNILWKVDDRTFLIQTSSTQLHTYPLGGDTFMSRLLNAETAEAAVKEFHTRATSAQAEATH